MAMLNNQMVVLKPMVQQEPDSFSKKLPHQWHHNFITRNGSFLKMGDPLFIMKHPKQKWMIWGGDG